MEPRRVEVPLFDAAYVGCNLSDPTCRTKRLPRILPTLTIFCGETILKGYGQSAQYLIGGQEAPLGSLASGGTLENLGHVADKLVRVHSGHHRSPCEAQTLPFFLNGSETDCGQAPACRSINRFPEMCLPVDGSKLSLARTPRTAMALASYSSAASRSLAK